MHAGIGSALDRFSIGQQGGADVRMHARTYLDRLPVQLLRVLETVLDECDEVGVAAQAERRLRPAAHRRKQRLHCTHYGTGPHGLPHIARRCRRVLSSTHCMRESLPVCTPWPPRLVYR